MNLRANALISAIQDFIEVMEDDDELINQEVINDFIHQGIHYWLSWANWEVARVEEQINNYEFIVVDRICSRQVTSIFFM